MHVFSIILIDILFYIFCFLQKKRTCRLNFYLTAGPLFYTLKFSF